MTYKCSKFKVYCKFGIFLRLFCEHLKPFKKKTNKLEEVSSLVSYGMTITILIILLCYVEVISLASQVKNVNKPNEESGPRLIIPTHEFESRVFLLRAHTNHDMDQDLQKRRTLYQKSFLTNLVALISNMTAFFKNSSPKIPK